MQNIHLNKQFNPEVNALKIASHSAPFSAQAAQPTGIAKSSFQPEKTSQSANWNGSKIRDAQLRKTIANRFMDGVIDRFDMLKIFSRAGDGGRVEQTEFRDLKTIVRSSSLGLSEDVKNLAQKVILGNVANQHYQGEQLGNLQTNSTAAHLQKLVNKWFFGSDRPTASSTDGWTKYSYRNATASLFQDGASYSDIRQGDLGNCYFLSSLASAAVQSPQQLQSMFIDNGDGTFAVRFYKANGEADYVTVDRKLPVNRWNKSAYADGRSEVWVALAEKAYVQWRESGAANSNSYQNIAAGYSHVATRQITNRKSDYQFLSDTTSDAIATAFASGTQITIASKPRPEIYIESRHAYTLLGYSAETQTFTLYNPWGSDGTTSRDSNPDDGRLELTWNELNRNFDYWSFTAS
ncbi:peptidase C2 calpain [Microcoleus sp. FACHB-1515]|uniref:C2 family cysteine protease n=1 Tax=Cyanophyceae TaxID=3028117 RepID=UPI001686EE22|nr:C2 family cysteine protease [Microcoleus sp. FACHB-1515]MBD2088931.1 peptidase C2 calpain [Microcoleus sp. FACHB-1515]